MNGLKRYRLSLFLFFLGMLVFASRTGASSEAGAGEVIPDLFVSMPADDQPAYALVVEKKSQQLTLFQYDGQYRAVKTMKCSTGKIRGAKSVQGDKKTPEGVYFFTRTFGDQDLAPLYGTRAFPLDYPNFMDRRQGRNGYAIWMHGTNRPLKDRDSNGCIALVNRDIDKLSDYIALKDTPILIAQTVGYKPAAQAAKEDERIRSFLADWNSALARGSYHDYLAFYDSGYLPHIAWWMRWVAVRNAGPQAPSALATRLYYLGIYKHQELYTAVFDQKLAVDGLEEIAGRRKMYISLSTGAPLIVGDTFMAAGSEDKKAPAAYPLVVAARTLRDRHLGEAAIADFFDRWLKAWSSKDIRTYGDCYGANFRSKKMDRRAWIAYKQRLNKAYRYINVSAENIKIQRDGDSATVTFHQTYASSAHKGRGVKTLILNLENGKWKIFRETFIRN